VQAKGFTAKAEFEESEGLGCPTKKVFDFVKNGLLKLINFPDYTQYMVRGGVKEVKEEGGGGTLEM
jgi:hypothetical protein